MTAGILAAMAVAGDLPVWLFVGTTSMLAVGAVDDIIALRPVWKLVMQTMIAIGVVVLGPRLIMTGWPALDKAIAVFWLVAVTNAFNLIDGLDGLASGIGIISSAAIAAIALYYGDQSLGGYALAIVGALCGFLVFNAHPASIFMGDTGALAVGFLLGEFSLRVGYAARESPLAAYFVPGLVILVPLLDMAIVSLSRMATGFAISRRGLDHSHHRLRSLGLSDWKVVTLAWTVASLGAALGVAIAVVKGSYLRLLLPLFGLPFALLGIFLLDLTFDAQPPGIMYRSLPQVARTILNIGYRRPLVNMALDGVVISAAYFTTFVIYWNFHVTYGVAHVLLLELRWILVCGWIGCLAAGVYKGIWRYTGPSDIFRYVKAALITVVLVKLISFWHPIMMSRQLLAVFAILLVNLIAVSRISFRMLREGLLRLGGSGSRVLIVGTGANAVLAAEGLVSGQHGAYRLVGFIGDDSFKWGRLIVGRPVLGALSDIEHVYEHNQFDQIVIAAESGLQDEQLAQVQSFADSHQVPVGSVSMVGVPQGAVTAQTV